MKRCPACNQTYADDELSFCINDGTALLRVLGSSYDPQATIMAPPPSVTEPPPPGYNDAGSGWSTPSSYTPPQSWNSPGAWQPPPPPPQPLQSMPPAGMPRVGKPQPQPLAVASLICGIIGITVGLICGGPFMAIVAIVLGIIGLLQIKNAPQRYSGKALAIIGIALGALWIVFILFWILIFIIGAVTH